MNTPALIAAILTLAVTAIAAGSRSAPVTDPAPKPQEARPFTTTGRWSHSSLSGHEPAKSSLWSTDPKAEAIWKPLIRSASPVRLSLWVIARAGNDKNARIEITHGGRTDSQVIDTESGEPRWLTLGTFDFSGKGDEEIRIRHGGKGNLRLSALRAEILDTKNDMVWQTLIFDDVIPYDPVTLKTAAPADLKAGPANPEQWELAFSDDFNGDKLDMDVWKSAQGDTWGSLQSARFPENAIVQDGLLRLVTRKEKRGGKEWTTAFIQTRTFKQKYGYWEARFRYAAATGLNQAFWMYTGGPKPDSFEIDVNEGHYPNAVNVTLHQGGLPSKSKRYDADYDLSADFHLYAVEWNEAEVIYYFDGKEIQRLPNVKAHREVPAMFSTAVLLWAGPISDSLDGKGMDVDWVRVYRKK